jgi:hypothetical protein
MAFVPFTAQDFQAMSGVSKSSQPASLGQKIADLRAELGAFPEFELSSFAKRIVRRPSMQGKGGLVFGEPRWNDKHWFLYNVGGDQDQVQLNVGMYTDYIRVGLGFQIGRQVMPKPPAFTILQTFLAARPPIPFRSAFLECLRRNAFHLEHWAAQRTIVKDPHEIISYLETYVLPAGTTVFFLVGALWDVTTASQKTARDYEQVFLQLLPFYEEFVLAGGRYQFHA